MKINVSLDVGVRAKAVLAEDTLTLELSAGVPYGTKTKRVCTTSESVPREELTEVGKQITAIIEKRLPALLQKAQANAQEAMRLAMAKGEE